MGRSPKSGSSAGQLGGADWGDLDDPRAFEILNTAAASGVTFCDMADVYGAGRSETLIGEFLKRRNEDFFVSTKLGRMPDL